jgi:hypothetical protein
MKPQPSSASRTMRSFHMSGSVAAGERPWKSIWLGAAGREIQMHAAHAGDAANLRVDGGLHQGGGNRSVHDVAAGTEDVGSGIGGPGLGGRDHCVAHGRWSSALMTSLTRGGRRGNRLPSRCRSAGA